ncbi:MAG TPA: RagB/SusD family nutrient uptake outer membrane protein [Chitinophagaceae bacterium]|nr:RagB/SusD family nutrient uptake outer membrane protein [Chitinophagaceae bacterium]
MKLKKYSLLLIAAALFIGGCKKGNYDLFDPESISEANAFQTLDHVQLGVNGAFGRYGAYTSQVYAGALVSDESKIGADNGGQGALTFRYQFSADATTGGDVTPAWAQFYSVIDQCNRVLPKIPLVTATPDQEYRRDILKGQLLALRGISLFGALQMYCKNWDPADPMGVPVLTSADPLAKPARNTQLETMTQIENDLAAAKLLLPAVTPATFSDTVMNRVNIAAYQARIALHKGDYNGAIAFATEVINSNVKPLVSGANFSGIWTDANFNESLFRVRYLTLTNLGGLWTTTGNLVYISPSDKLVATYSASDVRKAAYIGTLSGKPVVNKHFTSSRGGRIVDLKACRTAEMYLIRAEAYAKKGAAADVLLGAADLNFLRSNRITGYVNVVFGTAADLLTATLDERYKELCFEGFRFWDLRRNNLPVARLASDASPDWQNLPANSFRFILPIPQREIDANHNVIQNTGY